MNKIGRKILITIGIVGLLLAGCSSKGNNQMSTVPGEEQITKEEKALTEIYDEITENVGNGCAGCEIGGCVIG